MQAVQLVPALPTRLLPMLVQNMPHKLRDRSAQCLYLNALIALSEGKVGPALREGLLGGLVEHLLSIDADIRWEDIVDAPTGRGWVKVPPAQWALPVMVSCHGVLSQGFRLTLLACDLISVPHSWQGQGEGGQQVGAGCDFRMGVKGCRARSQTE
jgi:hypothetical protein